MAGKRRVSGGSGPKGKALKAKAAPDSAPEHVMKIVEWCDRQYHLFHWSCFNLPSTRYRAVVVPAGGPDRFLINHYSKTATS